MGEIPVPYPEESALYVFGIQKGRKRLVHEIDPDRISGIAEH